MELKRDNDNNQPEQGNQPYNGDNSYYQNGGNNSYVQPNQSNPYGQVNQSNPYGQPNQNNPYNQGNSYGPGDAYNPYNQGNVYGQQDAYYAQRTMVNGGYVDANRNTRGAGVAAVAGDFLETALAKSFMYMFLALLVSGITAFMTANASGSLYRIFWGSGSMAPLVVCFIIEFALVIAATMTIKRNNVALSAVLFFSFAIVNGFTLSVVLLVYQTSSVVSVFFITAVIFGIMAFIGATTKRDLTSIGSLLFMGLIGIILAGVVNMFLHSSGLDFAITIIGIIVFIGLTAYDTQKIKELARANTGLDVNVIGLYGAMTLYLDFINLFLKLLRLLGKRQ